MMDQEDKNVEYVSFNDTFMPGTELNFNLTI